MPKQREHQARFRPVGSSTLQHPGLIKYLESGWVSAAALPWPAAS
jgi:hypothetical protein